VCQLGDAGDVQPRAVTEANLCDGDQLRALIDETREVLERNVAVCCNGHVHHLGAEALLRMPDLGVARKLEVADDDLVAPAAEIQRARERVDTGGGRGSDGDLIRAHAQHLRHGRAHRLLPAEPALPVRAHRQPIVQVGVDSLPHGIGQRAIRAAVEIGLALEQRESAPQRAKIARHVPRVPRNCLTPKENVTLTRRAAGVEIEAAAPIP
jgi:hypothetical protein